MDLKSFCVKRVGWCLGIVSVLVSTACASPRSSDSDPSSTEHPSSVEAAWQAGTILDVRTRRPVSMPEWLKSAARADVVYLGEEHHNREHVDAALRVLQALVAAGRRPVLGLEMFSWDGQAALDRQVSGPPLPVEEFLAAAKWTQNWGGSYEDYQPLVRFAREHQLRLRALNAPRPLVRKVAKEGVLRVVGSAEAQEWGMRQEDIVDDVAYRRAMIGQLKACHGGGEDRDYEPMYEASLFRDEAMAKTVAQEAAAIMARGDRVAGPVVSYTGGGHIQYRLPIPQRVERRLGERVTQITIYLASYEPGRTEEIHEWLDQQIADFIWLTPLGAHGPPRRCR